MKRVLALVSSLAMLFVACENSGEDVNGGANFQLTSSSTINIGAEEYAGEILYSIAAPVEGATVEATTDVAWISELTCAESVTFKVAANATTQSRSGKITLTYDVDSISVLVVQGGAEQGSAPYLKISSEQKLNFSAVGGAGEILYTIVNGSEGLLPDVTTETPWITDIAVDAEKIGFMVQKNTLQEVRNGAVVITLGNQTVTIKVQQDAAANEPILVVDETYAKIGEPYKMTVVYNAEDVTAEAKICDYYTHEEITVPVTFTEVGERVFYAEYNGKRSKVLTIDVVPAATPAFIVDSDPDNFQFNYRMLLVNHTGIHCGYCPGMKSVLKELSENPEYNTTYNVVYAHTFDKTEADDPCYSADAYTLFAYYKGVCAKSYMPLTGYPSVTLNYQHDHAASTTTLMSQLDLLKRDVADAAVAVATVLDGDNVIVSAEIKSSVTQYYRMSVWVLENDIYAKQSGGYESWMNTHKSVIRDCVSGVAKEDASGVDWGYVSANDSSRRVFTFPLDKNPLWNRDNLSLIVIISAPMKDDNSKYEVVNTVMCKMGEGAGFEYK